MTHRLKTWTGIFQDVIDGKKPFEIRKNDRGFRVGDYLLLEEWNPETQKYTGRQWLKPVTYILNGGQFGIEEGYIVMSIK